jgi:hypothetical protein
MDLGRDAPLPHEATSAVLQRLRSEALADGVTLGWLLESLKERSFGIVLLLLGTAGLLPGVSAVAGLLLAIPAFQMALGRPTPSFPRRIAGRPIATARFNALIRRAIPVLRFIERFVRPRWQMPFRLTKRAVGLAVMVLGACLLVPLPLSNVPPALLVVLMAIAYLEEDGVLLLLAMVASLALAAVMAVAVWGTVETTLWIGR